MLMVKKVSLKSKKHIQRTDTHWVVRRSLLSYAIIVFITFVLLCLSVFLIDRLIVNKQHNDRYEKIMSIYSSLQLGDQYRQVKSDVFGDKRVYSWDKGRTYSSSIEYGHNDTPANTAADLKKKIEAAGFTYVQTEYEGSTSPIQEFKNDKGNWIRAQVSSKYLQDQIFYGTTTDAAGSAFEHKDDAPTYVTLKVNLDDNNE